MCVCVCERERERESERESVCLSVCLWVFVFVKFHFFAFDCYLFHHCSAQDRLFSPSLAVYGDMLLTSCKCNKRNVMFKIFK